MRTKFPDCTGCNRVIGSAKHVLAAAAIGAASSMVLAEPQWGPARNGTTGAGALRAEIVESAFWICDYVATTKGVHFTPVHHCAAVTEELKQKKFGGDFEQMLNWWRNNKVAEHGKLAAKENR